MDKDKIKEICQELSALKEKLVQAAGLEDEYEDEGEEEMGEDEDEAPASEPKGKKDKVGLMIALMGKKK